VLGICCTLLSASKELSHTQKYRPTVSTNFSIIIFFQKQQKTNLTKLSDIITDTGPYRKDVKCAYCVQIFVDITVLDLCKVSIEINSTTERRGFCACLSCGVIDADCVV